MVSRPTSLPPAPTSDPRTCARRRGAALWSTLVLGACTGGSPTPAPAGPAPATPASVEAPAIATPAASAVDRPAATPTQTAAELRPPAPADATPTSPPVITPTTPVVVAGSGEPPQLPLPPIVAAAGLERVDPGWTLALELDRSVGLEPVDAGVLCRVGGQAHEIGPDGALVARPAVDAGRLAGAWEDAPLLGAWPGDAWYVREKSRDREGSLLTFMRWRGNNRWVAQNDSSDYDENDVLYRWSPRSGMLVTRTHHEDETVTVERLAGKHPSPPDIPLKDGQRIEDLFESAGGTLFLFVDPQADGPGEALEILRSCADGPPGCERLGGAALAIPTRQPFHVGPMAARLRESISAVIVVAPAAAAPGRSFIVHHETGGWKLEATPGDPTITRLLAAPDGGLWIVSGDALWHRSAGGRWASVTLPERRDPAERVQLALRDEGHVWLAVNAGDHHALYAAPAVQQAAAGVSPPG